MGAIRPLFLPPPYPFPFPSKPERLIPAVGARGKGIRDKGPFLPSPPFPLSLTPYKMAAPEAYNPNRDYTGGRYIGGDKGGFKDPNPFPPIPSLPPSINPNNPEIIKKFYILFFICTSLGPEILNIIPSIGIYYYRMMITGFC